MKLIVGLGNPGPEYANHRHNVGFMVVDELLRRTSTSTVTKFQGEMARVRLGNEDVILLKPMTYMNNSGSSVGRCGAFYKLDSQDVIIVHDELDLEFGVLRVKASGGHAGHNGLRSIFQHFSPGEFPRIRVGIGRSKAGPTTKHVLSPFTSDEAIELERLVDTAADAVEVWSKTGVAEAMNRFNTRPSGPSAAN